MGYSSLLLLQQLRRLGAGGSVRFGSVWKSFWLVISPGRNISPAVPRITCDPDAAAVMIAGKLLQWAAPKQPEATT